MYYATFAASSILSPALIGFVGAKNGVWMGAGILWAVQGKLLKINYTMRTAGKHSSTLFGIAQSAVMFAATFVLIILIIFGNEESYTPFRLHIVYSIFCTITIASVFIFLLMRMTSTSMSVKAGTIAAN
uniref:Cytochrome b561 domain-containing protein n=1 Tax=Rhabditophanes sp. KR3021 TaxID=114890 RepID=A0AC35TFR7_9BILA